MKYPENGGGSLTSNATIEFSIDKRTIQRDGKLATITVLRVLSYKSKYQRHIVAVALWATGAVRTRLRSSFGVPSSEAATVRAIAFRQCAH